MTPGRASAAVDLPAGYRLHRFDTLDSTNDEALRRIADGAGHGEVFRALRQTAGRGRRGRTWHSPAGNLHVSIIAALPAGRDVGQLAFVAALAVGAALDGFAPIAVDLRYKWPNDILLGGRKVAGILIETALAADGGGHVAIGVGVNLAEAPDDAARPATSLRAAGAGEVAGERVLGALCQGFEDWYRRWADRGFAPVREAWLARAAGIGSPIEARLVNAIVRGTFLGIDAAGALVVATADGERRFPAAEVYFAANRE